MEPHHVESTFSIEHAGEYRQAFLEKPLEGRRIIYKLPIEIVRSTTGLNYPLRYPFSTTIICKITCYEKVDKPPTRKVSSSKTFYIEYLSGSIFHFKYFFLVYITKHSNSRKLILKN
ncbi:hypothetical protein NPIL_285911 [Nephila pilipes]|uniref:Uncharacterized protein n=1 Tax=Nephila pilipes TaxID=299642 RepID=A0A8X6N7V0_NEPPI|nr:hypothetical protein NPIL_285911 [Nephila pilipes]